MNILSFRVPSNFLPLPHDNGAFFLLEGRIERQTGEVPAMKNFGTQQDGCPLQRVMLWKDELHDLACALLENPAVICKVVEVHYENIQQGDQSTTRVRGLAFPEMRIPLLEKPASA